MERKNETEVGALPLVGTYARIGAGAFRRTTDNEGIVEFNNLPLGEQSFRIDDSELNRYGFNGDEIGEVTISLDRIAEFTATLDEVPETGSLPRFRSCAARPLRSE